MLEQHSLENSDLKRNESSSQQCSRLLTIKQLCTDYPWPSESALRSYVYKASQLGLSGAFFRIGRRVLVDPVKFFSLIKQIENHSKQGN